MKRAIFIVLINFSFVVTKAQSIAPQLVSFCGNTITGGGYSLDYSLGEIATTTISVTTNKLTQGFQQPDYYYSTGIKELETGTISIYPNPTSDFINVIENKCQLKNIIFYDLTGKVVLKSNSNKVDISILSSGIYLAVVTTNEAIQRIKIIKQ
jgi:hypothetical protein